MQFVASTTPLQTPIGSPALTHHDPWAHAAICCDHDHGASTSMAHQHQPQLQTQPQHSHSHSYSTSSTFPSPFVAQGMQTAFNNQLQQATCNPHTGEHNCQGECPLETYCCGGDYCCDDSNHCEGSEECCEDPSCEESSAVCHDDHDCGSQHDHCGHPHSIQGIEGLEGWTDAKEGCNTIQQLLECCNQPDCDIPVCTTDNATIHPPPMDPVAAMFAAMAAQPAIPTASADLTPTSTVEAMTHTCHWGNCHLVFKSMPDLLAHVASDHLSAWGTGPKPPAQDMVNATVPPPQTVAGLANHNGFVSTPPQQSFNNDMANLGINTALTTPQTSETDQLLSCLWDDCFPMPDLPSATSETFHSHNLPQQSSDLAITQAVPHAHNQQTTQPGHGHRHDHMGPNGEPFSPGTMLRHVLEEHLGVPGEIIGWPDQSTLESQKATSLIDHHHHHHHVDPHHLMHHHGHHHHHQFPTPPSTVNTTSSTSPTPVSGKPLICLWPGCPVEHVFPDSASLMDHLSEVHIPKGKDSYACHWDGCGNGEGRVFKSRQKVLRHLQSHTGHKPFVCGVCDQAFSEAAPLSAHMRRHAQQKPFKCEYPGCGKTFAVSSSLTIHMRTHNGEKPYICPHCGRGFVEASNLTKHIRTHTGERPFACAHPGCGKRFSRPDQLKRHMSVHDKPAGSHARRRSTATVATSATNDA
ncbi:hypothetical protein I316_02144 [Kwoniella heveanensis BCC8398]|uniref:C2H2-type domain-containing protein n=1 Tax=Kwoniella heveanensis BCC8398 TaxID=1296120 RepID=A0A1B9GZ24_9TREE|nr:hypothetical protein I316_02144 [Kwoniella heveanensis BCC8398]